MSYRNVNLVVNKRPQSGLVGKCFLPNLLKLFRFKKHLYVLEILSIKFLGFSVTSKTYIYFLNAKVK